MADENAKARAALRLVEILTPAAALGVPCRGCGVKAERACLCAPQIHDARLEDARAELHALLLTLGLGV